MSELDPRALEAAARANYEAGPPIRDYRWHDLTQLTQSGFYTQARAAITAYLQSAPPEIRIGDFTIRHAPKGIWIGRTDGEGGEFAAADVEVALAQFYRANF